MSVRCDYRWPLVEPNDEDRHNGVTHWCRHDPDHDGDHLCACGELAPGPDDRGPLAQLYLNAEEAQTLAVACGLLMHLTESMTDPAFTSLAEAAIALKEGPAGTARLDQVVARARERRPLLQSLITALLELGDELDREAQRLREDEP
jgi:hypothetical protein